ncbi:MAG: S8 family serine peptidase [Aquaticitalea sp.]
MKKNLLLIALVFCQGIIYAQQDAWIYLTDKENVASSIANPISILTQQSINRKAAHGIAIDSRDVPVNENYVTLLKSQQGITVKAKSKWFNAVHVRGTETAINALEQLSFVNHIDFANRNLNRTGRFASSQNKFEVEQTLVDFNYGDTSNQVEMIGVDNLHLSDFTGEGIVIAVIDAGFVNVNTMGAFERIRSNGKLLNGYDFVNRTSDVYAYTGNTHGTKVLSTMAGYIQDSYVGTAPDASYYLFRTEDAVTENPVEESYWVEAAERADSLGVHIINSSLGYTTFDNSDYDYTPAEMDGQTAFISRGADIASEKGILVVNSAGNWGNDPWQGLGAPADAMNVFTIGGVDASGDYAVFSSRGSDAQSTVKPDVVARAVGTFVVNENNNITNNNGTSFSSPLMAGAMACLMQALPMTTIEELKQFVRMSASQYTTPDNFLGYGIPNMQLALNLALSVEETPLANLKIYPNPVLDQLYIQIPFETNGQLLLFDVLGKVILEQTLNESETVINASSIPRGIYILKIDTSLGSKTLKLIKS